MRTALLCCRKKQPWLYFLRCLRFVCQNLFGRFLCFPHFIFHKQKSEGLVNLEKITTSRRFRQANRWNAFLTSKNADVGRINFADREETLDLIGIASGANHCVVAIWHFVYLYTVCSHGCRAAFLLHSYRLSTRFFFTKHWLSPSCLRMRFSGISLFRTGTFECPPRKQGTPEKETDFENNEKMLISTILWWKKHMQTIFSATFDRDILDHA